MIHLLENGLRYSYNQETVLMEAWGPDSVRIRAGKGVDFPKENWALSARPEAPGAEVTITETGAELRNGKLLLQLTNGGKISVFHSSGTLLLEEFCRNRRDVCDPRCSALEVEGREFRPIPGGDYHLTARFESLDPREKIFGMGQYQQPYLNLKGTDLELAHRNSQASVPFFLSSLGYGFLWNNPAVGRAVFGKNCMSFEAFSTKTLDYWVTVGDSPREMEMRYASVTGTVPMMPEYGLGFWQCKLRYQTQEELLEVAREYKRRNLPIDVIVVDYFHWPKQGEWKFDPTYWPDPDAMIAELKEMGIELMVSVWPTVDKESENFREMLEKGYLIRCDRGVQIAFDFLGNNLIIDPTNPEARKYVWEKAKKHYYQKGVRIFWLDEAEPEYNVYDFDNYRYFRGPNVQIGNLYPVEYAKTFYEGMVSEGQEHVVNLLRCAWAGSQKYGALVWSGDIASSFEVMRSQVCAGLNMGLAGIPWWTTDIGGFHGGDPNDPAFRELFVRWFQWATFLPVMRLHGDREPKQPQLGTTGGCLCLSGADNEVWSYGEEVYKICQTYLALRENLRDYTRTLMAEAHEKGLPVIRTLFFEFPEDPAAWEIEDEYLYGDRYLVAPILEAGARERRVYLPKGAVWKHLDGETYDGGQWVTVPAPLDTMPVFEKRNGSADPLLYGRQQDRA